MKTFFYLQFKRVTKILPFVLIISLLLAIAVAVVFQGIVETDAKNERFQRFRVGLVGDVEGTYLGMGVQLFSELDSSQYSIEFIEMSQKQAEEQLEDHKINIFIVIPDNFIEEAMTGNILPLKYYTLPSDAGLILMFKDEITLVVSDMLIHSQKGVYATAEVMRKNGIKGIGKTMNNMSLEYVAFILDRTSIYNTRFVGIADSLSFTSYMFCGVVVFFLMLIGISCSPVFVKRDMVFSKVMASRGKNALKQVTGEYLAYSTLLLIILYVILTFVTLFNNSVGILPELQRVDLPEIILMYIKIIPTVAIIAALQFLLFELCSNIINGVLLQFTVAVSLSYIGGCLYPIYFFSKSVQKVSAFLPTGMARSYFSSCFRQDVDFGTLIGIMGYIVLLFVLTVIIRNFKIKRRQG